MTDKFIAAYKLACNMHKSGLNWMEVIEWIECSEFNFNGECMCHVIVNEKVAFTCAGRMR